jgi:hypothetical protein
MALARRSFGAFATGYNTTVTPAMPAGWAAGDVLILFAANDEAATTQSVTSGWTLLSPNSGSKACNLWGRIAQMGDTSPGVTTSGPANQAAMIAAYTGGPTSISGIVNVSGDRANSSTQQILCQLITPITPTVANCAVIAVGCRVKTSAADGETVNALSGFTTVASSIGSGATVAAVYNDWIQTTPTAVGGHAQTTSVADTAGNTLASYIAIIPGTGGGGGGGGYTIPGFQSQACTTTSWTGDSLQQSSSPAVTTADTFYVPLVDNFGYAVSVNGAGNVTIAANSDPRRQALQYYILRGATNTLDGPANVWFNEVSAQWAQGVTVTATQGAANQSINLASVTYAQSPSGDTLVFALASGALPPGSSLSTAGGLVLAFTTDGTYTFTINATDITGTANASPTCTIVIQAGASTGTVPNLEGLTSAVAQTDITTAGFPVGSITGAPSTEALEGLVINQSPASQSVAPLTTPVSFVLGSGLAVPNPPVLELPSVVGQTPQQAAETLAEVGAVLGNAQASYDD